MGPLQMCELGEASFHILTQLINMVNPLRKGFPGGSVIKNTPADVKDSGLIPGLGRSPGEENGNPFQFSCLENSMHRRAW